MRQVATGQRLSVEDGRELHLFHRIDLASVEHLDLLQRSQLGETFVNAQLEHARLLVARKRRDFELWQACEGQMHPAVHPVEGGIRFGRRTQIVCPGRQYRRVGVDRGVDSRHRLERLMRNQHPDRHAIGRVRFGEHANGANTATIERRNQRPLEIGVELRVRRARLQPIRPQLEILPRRARPAGFMRSDSQRGTRHERGGRRQERAAVE